MAGVPKTEFVLNENTNRNFFKKKATRKKISGKPGGLRSFYHDK